MSPHIAGECAPPRGNRFSFGKATLVFLPNNGGGRSRAGRLASAATVALLGLSGFWSTTPAAAVTEPAGGFLEIPAGRFKMGSPPTEWQSRIDEEQRVVVLSRAFLLARHEVTQRLWTAVMGANPSYLDLCPDCPVERVSWSDAVLFCNALSRRDGLEPVYTVVGAAVTWDRNADGYRLPTEAEWEYACRAGTTTAYGTGDCLATDAANFKGYTVGPGCPTGLWRGQALPAGSFPANAFGLHDMHGNIAEWCWDFHGAPTPRRAVDPFGPPAGVARIVRGGSFDHPSEMCRSASRMFGEAGKTSRYIGLRLARNKP